VELMIVISIIVILATMLAPAVDTAIKSAYTAVVRARVNDLNMGCIQYYKDHQFYPGQNNLARLGTSTTTITGSQMLAEAMFINYSEANWDGGTGTGTTNKSLWNWKSLYAPLNFISGSARSDLMPPSPPATTGSSRPYCIADRFKNNFMPVLYYPAHPMDASGGILNGRAQFMETDNSVYTTSNVFSQWSPVDPNDTASFMNFIWDKRFKFSSNQAAFSNAPYNAGQYLLIAAGRDRMYGTRNTIKNWND
jgi:type II secretory pathway pseudopilin PulG